MTVARVELSADRPAPQAVEAKPAGDAPGARQRLASVDRLRGLVMIIMALDHTRDLFSDAAFDPTDLSRTGAALFLTRWITHFCAPTFVLLAGMAAYLSTRTKPMAEVSGFLLKRGLWLILLEVAVVTPFGWAFNFGYSFTRPQVIWAIGAGLVLLAGLVRVAGPRTIGLLGLVIVFTHNLFDGGHAQGLGPLRTVWGWLDQPQRFHLGAGHVVFLIYPVLPWLGILALGYGAGTILTLRADVRRRALWAAGLGALALFAALRALNRYGDPDPWSAQPTELFTLLSFINVHKYPPSLFYALLTLGRRSAPWRGRSAGEDGSAASSTPMAGRRCSTTYCTSR